MKLYELTLDQQQQIWSWKFPEDKGGVLGLCTSGCSMCQRWLDEFLEEGNVLVGTESEPKKHVLELSGEDTRLIIIALKESMDTLSIELDEFGDVPPTLTTWGIAHTIINLTKVYNKLVEFDNSIREASKETE